MWESDHKESWAPKNWWFWTVVLEKTLESPLDSWISSATLWICVWASSRSWWWTGKPGVLQFMDLQTSKPVNNPKGNQSWIFIGRTDVEAETPIFGHLMWRTNSLEKTLMLRKIEGRRRWGWQNHMVGLHHWLDGHEFEQVPVVGIDHGSLVYRSPWGHKEKLGSLLRNWTELNCT